MEASFAYDYKIILNKNFLENISINQFINLIENLSSESPIGKVEQLLSTPNKELKNEQIKLKNYYILKRKNADQNIDFSKGFWRE